VVVRACGCASACMCLVVAWPLPADRPMVPTSSRCCALWFWLLRTLKDRGVIAAALLVWPASSNMHVK
jgi:hypothetical protein